jgi:polar amino acid transport system substrate-binding protein
MRIVKRIVLLMVIALLAVTLIGVPGAPAAEDRQSVVEQVIQRGVLRVGMSTFVPWAMKDKTGKLIGFEIDVATRLAEDMGVKVEFVPTKWSGIIPALLTGKFDVIIGGMGILPSRNLKVNFTEPIRFYRHVHGCQQENGRRHDGSRSVQRSRCHHRRPTRVHRGDRGQEIPAQGRDPYVRRRSPGLPGGDQRSGCTPWSGRPRHRPFRPSSIRIKLFLPIEGTFTREPIGFAVRKGDLDTLNFFNNWIGYVGC